MKVLKWAILFLPQAKWRVILKQEFHRKLESTLAFPYYGSDIKLQTYYILKNLRKTFEAAGSSLDHIVKVQVFLTDLNNFNGFDEVWKEYFKTPPPRKTVGITGLLQRGTLIEIDLIGYVPR